MADYMSAFKYEQILGETDYNKRKTKIVCTIGPACWDTDKLVQLMNAGMTVARLNFSHGTHEDHFKVLQRIREAQKINKDKVCSIMLDTKGPEVRTGFLKDEKGVQLTAGQTLEITTDYTYKGDEKKIAFSYPALAKTVKVGSQILCADGTIVMEVTSLTNSSNDGITVRCMNTAKLGTKKNVNFPGQDVDLPTITEKDEDDIVNFGLKHGVDLIALSFARTAQDVRTCRDLLGPKGSNIKIICKIENQLGLTNYDEILQETDGIMVARGDLGMEIPPQKVFVAQKWMIKKANEAAKPVITATQMFESMIQNPRPTRAEASDVANAVLDGTDCTMLSGESASGAYPIIAVETMARVNSEAEICFDYKGHYESMLKTLQMGKVSQTEAMAASAVQLSIQINSNAIICFTETGKTARLLSKYSPKAEIVAIGIEEHVIKGLTFTKGVLTLRVPSFQGLDSLIEYGIKAVKEKGICKVGEKVIVIIGGKIEGQVSENQMKIYNVV